MQLETTKTEVFYRLLDLSNREKQAYLEQLKADNPKLYTKVLPLIEAEASDGLTQLINFHVSSNEEPELNYTGQTIGRYQIAQELGRGGMGVVYAACRADKIFEQQLAIKFLHVNLSNILDQRALFAEAQLLAKLNHPNIAKVFDGGVHQQTAYIVMEHVKGTSLDKLIERTVLSETKKLKLLRKICLGLEHAHQHGVIHGDIKPDNILIDENKQVKLIDFNLTQVAITEDQEHSSGLLAFSQRYASPEQKEGKRLCAKSDIYSLGKLIEFLFPDEKPLSDIDTIRIHATQKALDARYSSIKELRLDLENILSTRPISLKKHVPFYRSTRLFQRHPIPSVLALLLCLSGTLFSSALVLKNHQLEQEKLIAENMMFEVTSMMFHSTTPQARHISAHTMLDLTRRRILSNPDIPKHIKQKMLIAMMTPSKPKEPIEMESINAQL